MFMATARIDAVWVHDGMLDAARLQDRRSLATTPCADDPGREGAGVRARPGRTRRGLRLRLRYEYLQPEVDDDPEPWELDDDDLAAVEEELRAAVERMWADEEWRGVNEVDDVPHVPLPVDLSRQRGAGRARVAGPQH